MARQMYFDELKKKRKAAIRVEMVRGGVRYDRPSYVVSALQEEEECTFVPKTNNTADVLAASRFAGRLTEDGDEFLERLAHKDLESKEAKLHAMSNAEMAVYTFKPEINSISKLIGKVNIYLTLLEIRPIESTVPESNGGRTVRGREEEESIDGTTR